MKNGQDKRQVAIVLLFASALFFTMGFFYPLMQTGYGFGPITLRRDDVYMSSSVRYFFNRGEIFIGLILLLFTIIFPIIKYFFLLLTLLDKKFPRHHYISTVLEVINKWAMLDVFVVALLILNLKFDTRIIVSELKSGATLFAIAVVLLMACSHITGKYLAAGGGVTK